MRLFLLISLFLIPIVLFGQDLQREATLVNGGYSITGTATLNSDCRGNTILSLSNDFGTPAGPDVQIFLSNHETDISYAYFIENLFDTGHFSGGKSWNLGSSVGIDRYQYIIFRSVIFQLHWAGGTFGSVTGDCSEQNVKFSIDDHNSNGNQSICVPVLVENLEKVIEIKLFLNYDSNIIKFNSAKANPILEGNFLFTSADPNNTFITWRRTLNQPAISIPNGDTYMEVCFDIIGNIGETSPLNLMHSGGISNSVIYENNVPIDLTLSPGSITIGNNPSIKSVPSLSVWGIISLLILLLIVSVTAYKHSIIDYN